MSAPAIAAPGDRQCGSAAPRTRCCCRPCAIRAAIRGRDRDARCWDETAFDFQLSIAQILVSLVTCAVLEVAIAFRRQKVLMWPASALTGNGVAFVLQVPVPSMATGGA